MPIGQVSSSRDLECTQHGDIEVTATHHCERISVVEVATSRQLRDRNLPSVNEVFINLITGCLGAHAEHAVFGVKCNRTKTKEWINQVIKKEKFKLGELGYNFCSDEYLLQINIEHLNHDFYTDVITFELNEDKTIIGDIYISIDRVKDNAKQNSKTFTNELMRVLIHGVLHLCGYKDKTKKDAATMREKEDYYLSLL